MPGSRPGRPTIKVQFRGLQRRRAVIGRVAIPESSLDGSVPPGVPDGQGNQARRREGPHPGSAQIDQGGATRGGNDLEARLVHIHRSVLHLAGNQVLIKDTKTHSERTVAIDVETAARLEARRTEVEAALAGGPTLVELPYIFSHDGGERPWRPDYVTAAWRRLCNAAGVTGVRVHDLRHMHASYLLDAGVPLHTVSRRLGHERASTTSDIYGHAVDARDQGAADLFGALLNTKPDDEGQAES
ncbi:MAG TPA: site-specific integrase [Acidimicrobiales bacterium]|nr:site-specific integrase [Acidimicrobiales bacterium]